MNKSQINAIIVADSIDPRGNRTTTFELTVPRLILAEFNKHRMFSSNTSSSRAIPFDKMVESIQKNPFIPIAWQKTHKGMQGDEYFSKEEVRKNGIIEHYLGTRDFVISRAKALSEIGVTKQIINRLLEPFMYVKILATVEESGLENFFELRCPKYHYDLEDKYFKSKKDWLEYYKKNCIGDVNSDFTLKEEDWFDINKSQAEIHIQKIAEMMWDSYNESIPKKLKSGEWHIPYIDKFESYSTIPLNSTSQELSDNFILNDIKIATAMAARISYTTIDEEKELNYEKLINLHDRLLKDKHFSCFEHCRKVMSNEEYYDFIKGFVIEYDEDGNKIFSESSFGWCYNSKGFIPYRYIVENNIKI